MSRLVLRPEWGGGPFDSARIGPVDQVFIHHSVTNSATPLVPAMQMLEAHARALGHRAIDYSFCCFVNGERAEGRGWWQAGGHTINNNATSYGICGVGNFTAEPVTDALIGAIAETITEGINLGAILPHPRIRPHSDVFATACPGALRDAIPQIAARIGTAAPTTDVDSGDDTMYLYHCDDTNQNYLVDPHAAKRIATGVSPDEYLEFAKSGVKGNPHGHSLKLRMQVQKHLVGRLGKKPSADEVNAQIK